MVDELSPIIREEALTKYELSVRDVVKDSVKRNVKALKDSDVFVFISERRCFEGVTWFSSWRLIKGRHYLVTLIEDIFFFEIFDAETHLLPIKVGAVKYKFFQGVISQFIHNERFRGINSCSKFHIIVDQAVRDQG